jgi:hypothetical protein
MTDSIKNFLTKNEWLSVILLAVLFVALRLPGTGLPLHQDEYKWPGSVDPSNPTGLIPHPPMGEFIYRTAGYLVGFNAHFRFVPLFFGALNLFLLYYFVRFSFGKKEAVISSIIWVFSYFSVLASLMVDTDGQIMPFFFLIALIGYYKLKYGADKRYLWWAIFMSGIIFGSLVKMSFLVAVGAFVCDFAWSKRKAISKKQIIKYSSVFVGGLFLFGLFLFVAKYFFPFFDLEKSLVYWEHFATLDRGWFQTFIQCMKAVLYSSPFLVFIPFLLKKERISKVTVFFFFLFIAFIFYVVLFDFSIGALDRYLQLLILPLTILTSVAIVEIWSENRQKIFDWFLIGAVLAAIIFFLQFVPHYVPSLHPKSEWVARIFSLRWNFVYPFSGGSGPLGFYVSFLFMALSWIFSLVAVVLGIFRPVWRKAAVSFLLPIGIVYNVVFIEEYLVGYINGHAPTLVYQAAYFIKNDPEISKVIVYNDNGAEEVKATGKYFRRLYADPAFVESYKKIFSAFSGHILYIDVPKIDPKSWYADYISGCKNIWQKNDQKMTAIIYDCRNVVPNK